MGVKISELTSATSLTGSEELPIVQSGTTKKTTIAEVQNIATYKYAITSVSGTKSTNAWQNFTNTYTTETIPIGTYCFVVRFLAGGNNANGVITAKLLIDGNEENPSWRSTIPLPREYRIC